MLKLHLGYLSVVILAALLSGCAAYIFAEPPPRSYTIGMSDVDQDGDLDAFVGNGPGNTDYSGEPNMVWLNDGSGVFTDSGHRLIPANGSDWDVTHVVALGDLDRDGDTDAMFGNAIPSPNTVWFNDGAGQFRLQGQYEGMKPVQMFGYSLSTAIALGDVDGDGDLDAYIGNCCRNQWGISSGNKIEAQGFADAFDMVWMNDGEGNFIDSGQRLGNWATGAIALGDLDGDGDLDAFVANRGSGSEFAISDPHDMVWLNDGVGNFSDSGQRLSPSDGYSVALGDLDGDGDLDAFIGNAYSGVADEVWLNDGKGAFVNSGQRLGNDNTRLVSLDDVDRDGDLDAFVDYQGYGKIWLNDGIGQFVDSGQHFAWNSAFTSALADVDSDGYKDVFAFRFDGEQRVWYNNGEGRFDQREDSAPFLYLIMGGILVLGLGLIGWWFLRQKMQN